jgi:hypothetical protein
MLVCRWMCHYLERDSQSLFKSELTGYNRSDAKNVDQNLCVQAYRMNGIGKIIALPIQYVKEPVKAGDEIVVGDTTLVVPPLEAPQVMEITPDDKTTQQGPTADTTPALTGTPPSSTDSDPATSLSLPVASIRPAGKTEPVVQGSTASVQPEFRESSTSSRCQPTRSFCCCRQRGLFSWRTTNFLCDISARQKITRCEAGYKYAIGG